MLVLLEWLQHSLQFSVSLGTGFQTEDTQAEEVEDETDNDLVDCLTENHLCHVDGDQRRVLPVWLALEGRPSGRVGGESKSCKSVHDQVDPEQLNG